MDDNSKVQRGSHYCHSVCEQTDENYHMNEYRLKTSFIHI